VVVALVAGGCSDSSPPTSSSAGTSSASSSPASSAPVPTISWSSEPLTFTPGAVSAPAPGPRPDRFLGVTDRGVVVVVDAADGTVSRELASRSDPTEPQTQESAAYTYVRSVAQSLDGLTAYFSVAPEPACGNVSEMPVEGGEEETRGDGERIAPGPDGYFATSGGCALTIRKGTTVLASTPTPSGSFFHSVAWSPDGRYIAVEREDHPAVPLIVVFDLLAADPWASPFEIHGAAGVGYRLPAFRSDGRLVVVEQPEGAAATAKVVEPSNGVAVGSFSYDGEVVDQAYDASNTWLLVTLADGTVRWLGGGEQGDLATGYIAADW
jgi:hypothetical protein